MCTDQLLQPRIDGVCVQVKETQLVACDNIAQRLAAVQELTAAKHEVRDTKRMLGQCSDQLTDYKRRLNATETKLSDVTNGPICSKYKQAKTASKSATEQDDNCTRQLVEARASLKNQELKLKNLSSHLTQERERRIAAASAVEECSWHRNRLQRQLVKYATVFSRDSETADEEEQRERKNQGCNCVLQSKYSNKATEKTREPEEQVSSNPSTGDRNSCVRQLAAARENLKVQEKLSKNCSRRLEEERRNKTTATAAAETCELELTKTRRRLDTKTSSLTKCDDHLKEVKRNLNMMSSARDQCAVDLMTEKESTRQLTEQDRQSTKDLSSKLTKCSKELTKSAYTIHWMTPQLSRCSDNIAKARSEIQSLTVRLSDANTAKRRNPKKLKEINRRQSSDKQRRQSRPDSAFPTLRDLLSIFAYHLVPWLVFRAYNLILNHTAEEVPTFRRHYW